MMTTKRLDNFEVLCEWDSCNFKGHGMEELSDHMSLHLKEYLGDNDALEELGEWWGKCHVHAWEKSLWSIFIELARWVSEIKIYFFSQENLVQLKETQQHQKQSQTSLKVPVFSIYLWWATITFLGYALVVLCDNFCIFSLNTTTIFCLKDWYNLLLTDLHLGSGHLLQYLSKFLYLNKMGLTFKHC